MTAAGFPEVKNIFQIMGLDPAETYDDDAALQKLRYGHIVVMTDADHDGNHIKGLLIALFQRFFPALLYRKDFIQSFVTPIVKVSKGKASTAFYSQNLSRLGTKIASGGKDDGYERGQGKKRR